MRGDKTATHLQHFISVYGSLNKDNLFLLTSIYAPKIVFEDPAHKIHGLTALKDYFANLYQNIDACQFAILEHSLNGEKAFVQWQMTLAHPKLMQGKPRVIEGCSYIIFNDNLVIYQRDYFDLGEMLYEAIPVLGKIIRAIKRRLGQ